MRFLLKPGWVAFVLLIIGFAVACYTLLAPWQFRRNAERAEQNREIVASTTQPPRPLAELVPPGGPPAESVQWREAEVHGQYLPADEAVVRLRTVQGRPAFEVLTAFRTDEGRMIAVDRGYVRPGEDRQLAAFPPAPGGTVALTGRIRLDESDPQHRGWFTAGGHRQIYAADSQQLGQATGIPIAPGYLQLVDNQPGGLGVVPLPDLDSGPFLSYAWQWLTFGAMALFGLVYFIRLELLQRQAEQPRTTRADRARTAGAGEQAPQEGGTPTAAARKADGSSTGEPARTVASAPAQRARSHNPESEPDDATRAAAASAESADKLGALASVRAKRATLRAALRGEADPSLPSTTEPSRPGEPTDRDRLVERYGKARF